MLRQPTQVMNAEPARTDELHQSLELALPDRDFSLES